MADKIETFEQLEAWKSARELVRSVYDTFRRGAAARDFGLRDQAQRAAVSAMTNNAEGFERLHPAEKLQFYNVARASCGEVFSLSYVMLDVEFLSPVEHQQHLTLISQTGRLISGLLRSTRARTAY